MNARSLAAPAACVLVAAGLALGFSELGSPAHNRLVALDEGRADGIEWIAMRLIGHRDAPTSLSLRQYAWVSPNVRRDVTYARTGKRSYRLCATFALPSKDERQNDLDQRLPHPAGRSCFDFTTDSSAPYDGPISGH